MATPAPDRGATPLAPVERIVSGGQTGVDRAALDWALDRGIACGGWCPHGRRAEDAPIADRYPMRETASSDYEDRTRMNVVDSDGTLILNTGALTTGTALTVLYAIEAHKPHLVVALDGRDRADVDRVLAWLAGERIRTLNVAGPRETKRPGIYRLAYGFLDELVQAAPTPSRSVQQA